MFRKEDFNARAGGLRRFDEDEFVFVGQDHRWRWQLADANGFRQAAESNPEKIRGGAPKDRVVVIYCGLSAFKRTSFRSPSSMASTRISEGSMLW